MSPIEVKIIIVAISVALLILLMLFTVNFVHHFQVKSQCPYIIRDTEVGGIYPTLILFYIAISSIVLSMMITLTYYDAPSAIFISYSLCSIEFSFDFGFMDKSGILCNILISLLLSMIFILETYLCCSRYYNVLDIKPLFPLNITFSIYCLIIFILFCFSITILQCITLFLCFQHLLFISYFSYSFHFSIKSSYLHMIQLCDNKHNAAFDIMEQQMKQIKQMAILSVISSILSVYCLFSFVLCSNQIQNISIILLINSISLFIMFSKNKTFITNIIHCKCIKPQFAAMIKKKKRLLSRIKSKSTANHDDIKVKDDTVATPLPSDVNIIQKPTEVQVDPTILKSQKKISRQIAFNADIALEIVKEAIDTENRESQSKNHTKKRLPIMSDCKSEPMRTQKGFYSIQKNEMKSKYIVHDDLEINKRSSTNKRWLNRSKSYPQDASTYDSKHEHDEKTVFLHKDTKIKDKPKFKVMRSASEHLQPKLHIVSSSSPFIDSIEVIYDRETYDSIVTTPGTPTDTKRNDYATAYHTVDGLMIDQGNSNTGSFLDSFRSMLRVPSVQRKISMSKADTEQHLTKIHSFLKGNGLSKPNVNRFFYEVNINQNGNNEDNSVRQIHDLTVGIPIIPE